MNAQIERVRAARKAEAEGLRASGWARRFHNPEGYERQLAELRGESVPFINSTTVGQAQNGLAAVESYRGERIRDGVAVGRDPNRFDRVYTRELNSFERREWAPRLRSLRAQVESEEAKLRSLRGVGVPAAEIEARHDSIRIAELKRHRAERIAAVRAWESTEMDVTTSEAGAERLWRRWLTVGSEPEYVPQVIGGLPLP